jgi:hypothetical protein
MSFNLIEHLVLGRKQTAPIRYIELNTEAHDKGEKGSDVTRSYRA